ncbi:hypothetical protein BOTBODRAFT_28648 [Botryobasidium botryosum FD-172 SS1]|uniref:Uncharacterized protein n=1 Tax=Botryobasidium botryosum (strain FD-172 SS1) TaxID=930990 RepID=A0A067MU70_BOTB1|nr:hypothetical protein BOTBODRAFT_28648 [Botryobasidium botryosum FD-172 SS1]
MHSLGKNGFATPRLAHNTPDYVEELDQLATFALRHTSKPFPKLSTLSNYQHRDNSTLELLQAQLTALNDAHAKHLDALYTLQAEELEKAGQGNYLQYDPEYFNRPKIKHNDEIALAETRTAMLDFMNLQRRRIQSKHDDQLARLRHAHLITIMPIQKEIAAKERAVQADRARRAKILPRSYDEWELMDPAPKLGVARFLAAPQDGDNGRTNTMIKNQPHWAWDNYHALIKEYDTTNEFKAKVAKFIEENKLVYIDPRSQLAARRGGAA